MLRLNRREKIFVLVAAAVFICALSLLVRKHYRTGTGEGVPVKGGVEFAESVIMKAPLYRQRDPQWADDIVGPGGRMADVGCTVSSIAMLFEYMGIQSTPRSLNNYLKENEGYNRRSWLRWQKAADYTQGKMKLSYIGDPVYEIIDENLRKNNPVIIKVFVQDVIPHWVLIVGKKGYEYYINDPLNNNDAQIPLSYYGDTMYSLRVYEPTESYKEILHSKSL